MNVPFHEKGANHYLIIEADEDQNDEVFVVLIKKNMGREQTRDTTVPFCATELSRYCKRLFILSGETRVKGLEPRTMHSPVEEATKL